MVRQGVGRSCVLQEVGLVRASLVFHLNSRKHFLMVRAVRRWNKLPQRVMESPSLEVFRRRLDEYLSGESDF